MLFAYVVSFCSLILWLGICVEVAVDRISRISISPPFLLNTLPFFFDPTHNSLFNTSDSYLKLVRT